MSESTYSPYASFSDLKGKVLIEINGLHKTSEEVIFKCQDGSKYRMFHSRDCCESVEINDVCGEVSDLIGSEILIAEENESKENPLYPGEESFTWTFYKLATQKGYVDIRWYGSSNGYYSESVSFQKI